MPYMLSWAIWQKWGKIITYLLAFMYDLPRIFTRKHTYLIILNFDPEYNNNKSYIGLW